MSLNAKRSSPEWLIVCVALCAGNFSSVLSPIWSQQALESEDPLASRPNVLWLSSEDNGPHLGAYGDEVATTPRLDELAKRGMIYQRAWSNAPVCAPARTTIISGLYPTSTGSEHMRSKARLPEGFSFFPQLLRQAGYYTSNNAKEDYNLEKPGKVWDESSRQAHWRNRPDGKPFFSVFNFAASHESQIRRRPHTPVHDPSSIRIPAYHPDTPEVRRDWAQYYDKMTEVDTAIGAVLDQLEEDGLVDSTIVFYWGDHGVGLPRGKRSVLNSGLQVPLIVSIPKRFRHLAPSDWIDGGSTDRLVAFIDFAPTVLSLAGLEAPSHYQGAAFLGVHPAPEKQYLFGFRGRMDERIDMVRAVFDGRYVYTRNFMPHLPHAQHVSYMFQTPTAQIWESLWRSGDLSEEQAAFWQKPRPVEELYDLKSDPDEVRNLASLSGSANELERLRETLRSHMVNTRDLGFLPESDLRERTRSVPPWNLARDDDAYPLLELQAAAELASGEQSDSAALLTLIGHSDSAVRYWGALGFLRLGLSDAAKAENLLKSSGRTLENAIFDSNAAVAIVAAEFNSRFGGPDLRKAGLQRLLDFARLESNPVPVVWQALNALDSLDSAAGAVESDLRSLTTQSESVPSWAKSYIPRLVEKTLADLEQP